MRQTVDALIEEASEGEIGEGRGEGGDWLVEVASKSEVCKLAF